MYDAELRARALDLLGHGRSLSSVSQELGVARSTLRQWRDLGPQRARVGDCPRCDDRPLDPVAYAALLGFYLGDGFVSRQRSTYSLRVSCDNRHPRIVDDVTRLVVAVRGRGPVGHVAAPGCTVVCGYWNHWPCVFPQHGPGRKHERRLVMASWQQEVVDQHPAEFLRGLFHSDGCRVDNWATRTVRGEKRVYSYGRWQFVNHSPEIRQWCTVALDRLEIPWRQSSWKTVSVSRREGVARLDELVGPKC